MRRNPLNPGVATNIWIGPFIIEEIQYNGALKIRLSDGKTKMVNAIDLRPFNDRASRLEPIPEEPPEAYATEEKKRNSSRASPEKKPEPTLPIDQRNASGCGTQDS